jgi:hypothetical protein
MHSIESLLLSRHSVGSESEADATQSEEIDAADEEREKEREEKHNSASVESLREKDQRSCMHSVKRSLLRRRHSVGAAAGRERAGTRHKRKIDRRRKEKNTAAEGFQSKKDCYEAIIRSEAKTESGKQRCRIHSL